MKRRISVVLVALVICALVTGPALASPPYWESATATEDFTFAKLCLDFDFNYHLDMQTEGTRHDNGDGTYRWAIKVEGTGVFYNSANSKTVPITVHVNWQVMTFNGDYPPAHMFYNVLSAKRTGNLKVDLPGGARMYSEAGLFSFGPDGVKQVGHFPGPGDVPELCAALR